MTVADPDLVIAVARRWLGTPYHDQASLRGVGCDCLGLARGVWREVVGPEPFPIPSYSRDWGETGPRRGARDRRADGDDRDRARGGRARRAAALPDARRAPSRSMSASSPAPDRFIHAYERLGVIEEPLTPAWRRRVAFAFLFAATMDGRCLRLRRR